MTVRIEASNLPGRTCSPSCDVPGGYRDVRVGVQRRRRPDDLLGLVPGDVRAATWELACTARSTAVGIDVSGPHIQGPRGRASSTSRG